MKALGVCLGASTVSLAQVESNQIKSSDPKKKYRITDHWLHPHEGDPRKTLLTAFEKLDLDSFDRIAITGRKFRKFVNLPSIPEPFAVEHAYKFVKPVNISCPAIVSAGGETFMVYTLNGRGQISNVVTGNKCASGTGEFFLQQLRRMDVSMKEAAGWASTQEPYMVSGRCSVFCKSDCTHATNNGVPKSKVTAGLGKMMANKILGLLKNVEQRNIMLVGGTTRNKMMVNYLEKEIPGLIITKEAPYFEALGAALWAIHNRSAKWDKTSEIFSKKATSFGTLPCLSGFESMVEFKTTETGTIMPGDECIIGLDVGSTTTKAVLLRKQDNTILSSVYLRTHGDPVGASCRCYKSILSNIRKKVDPLQISITGLGVTGSGRRIAGLHAGTDSIINEIIAHATAAIYFDSDVDTIFEIGGQDAKYTFITNSVPSDYAMNEACSAGTGSFLEESAIETLGINMEDIADIAIKGANPPNFNDQCAAFIASDIKNVIHEGGSQEDIVAGLVYSICMNYSNRVKGNRPVGKKIFMQGGVCYNRAVPLAMASLIGKTIIVPPEPGLMGAFGVALEVKKRIDSQLIDKKRFDLDQLARRDVTYGKPFVCTGGKNRCDRNCNIARIELEGKSYPFGGACNRYYNLQHKIRHNNDKLNLVRIRQKLVFEKYGAKSKKESGNPKRGLVGINRSFMVNTYYPLYATFFSELGFQTVLPDRISPKGANMRNAPFCFPAEQSHGFFHSLLLTSPAPDYIFLPHFKALPTLNRNKSSQVCPFVQGETFYLQTTFREKLDELKKRGMKIFAPLIDFSKGLQTARASMVETAVNMGVNKNRAEKSFGKAVSAQKACEAEMREIGKNTLLAIESSPKNTGIVIFARSYNGFVEHAHMGIPNKFASRGYQVIPFDFLPFDNEHLNTQMYWGVGQRLLKAAKFVEKHPQLFGIFISNFSCGPDSFITGYFRSIMGKKPSLTLELDSHTADAGLETRVEAFLDIISAYRKLADGNHIAPQKTTFVPAEIGLNNGATKIVTSSGKKLSLTDPNVTTLIPAIGDILTKVIVAAFRGIGLNAVGPSPPTEEILRKGRANTSCKECLPLIITTGTLMNYIDKEKKDDEVLIYFMPAASGPCRFGQYNVFIKDLIIKSEIPDVTILSLTADNSYAGLGIDSQKKTLWGVVIADVLEDIRSMILANAVDIEGSLAIFNEELELILVKLENGNFQAIAKQLEQTAMRFSRLPMKTLPKDVPVIFLTGEIYVRRESLSRQYLTETLAKKGFAVICAPAAEWLIYSDYLVHKGLIESPMSKMEKLKFLLKRKIVSKYEKRIKSILASSGLVIAGPVNVESIVDNAEPYISNRLTGEAVLTVGGSLAEIASNACGVIAIGPFGCMPNRISEAILSKTMESETKLATDPDNKQLRTTLSDIQDLPFLCIESDGSPFPQIIDANLETFCLRSERLNKRMLAARREEVQGQGKMHKIKQHASRLFSI